MLIDIAGPAVLPLGLVKFENAAAAQTNMLGLTVQHPPVNLQAQAGQPLQIMGPRADVAYQQALHFLAFHNLPQTSQAEIEFAIPSLVGLGSESLLGLAVAQALAWTHDLPAEKCGPLALAQALGLTPAEAILLWGYDQGGLLLVDTEPDPITEFPAMRRRQEIAHKEKDAWAFVLYFPDVPDETPETLETDRLTLLWQAGPHLSSDSGRLVTEDLWPAVERDDIAAFGQSLTALQQMNQTALAQISDPVALNAADQAVLDLMRDNEALAYGRNLTGLSYYALVHGAKASQQLRQALRQQLGYFGGTVLATITDNRGAVALTKNDDLDVRKLTARRSHVKK
jgi:predicted sugar kinase